MSGDTLHLLYPIDNTTFCTEQGCPFPSKGNTWSSIKCSLLRHLKSAHHLTNLKSCHWCATCAKIKKTAKQPCLQHGTMIDIPIDTPYVCPDCQEPFPSELGLSNPVAAHKKQKALDRSVQRVIPRMGTTKWKRKKRPTAANSSEPPDESITDPKCVLATPIQDQTAPSAPPQQEVTPPGPLSIFIDHLDDFLNQDPTEDFAMFCETVDMAVTEVQSLSFQPSSPPPEQPPGNPVAKKPRKEVNVNDAQSCQSLFGRNRKRAVREICDGPPSGVKYL
ncbi:hypothetical protein AVEN_152184-1 [Araneus ventricosus]|uniref:Uncharacterized protein n=1 Tax=Araneus ventricosus TaxID=182803 RepID=A0A4Y2HKS1_ARAVE|nr:hypothetical protein AVEN_152184-1 [Araneus ventricosus]